MRCRVATFTFLEWGGGAFDVIFRQGVAVGNDIGPLGIQMGDG